MDVTTTGRKVTLSEDFKRLVEKKLEKFDRLLGDGAKAAVTVTVEKNRQTVETTIRHGGMIYRAESTTQDMENSLDHVVDILSRQFRKHKTRLSKRLRDDFLANHIPSVDNEADVPEELQFNVIRTKKFPVKPCDVDEAILEMNMIGHQFYMFKSRETGEMCVVYRRNDGAYGVLEPEIM